MADLFPLGLSITTLVLLTFTSVAVYPSTCRAKIEPFFVHQVLLRLLTNQRVHRPSAIRDRFFVTVEYLLAWYVCSFHDLRYRDQTNTTAFNSFSTSRWRHVPLACSAIPDGAFQNFSCFNLKTQHDLRSLCARIRRRESMVP